MKLKKTIKEYFLKKKIENIIECSGSVSLIIKVPDGTPDEMAVSDISDFLKSQNCSKFLIGINENKKTSERYYKVLADKKVDFKKWPYKISGSAAGKRLKAADYLRYFV